MLAFDAQVFRRFARNRSALLGGLLIAVLLATVVFAPLLAPHDPLDQSFPGSSSLPPGGIPWAPTSLGGTC